MEATGWVIFSTVTGYHYAWVSEYGREDPVRAYSIAGCKKKSATSLMAFAPYSNFCQAFKPPSFLPPAALQSIDSVNG